MPSPFHQKYSSQNHKFFGDNTLPSMPEAPKQDTERRASDASVGSNSNSGSPTTERRRSSVGRFANLESFKRPTDEASVNRRSSMQDYYQKPGFFGSWWHNHMRGGLAVPPPQQREQKEPRDTTTLRQ